MFNAHVLAYFHAQWQRHGLLALRARGVERVLHNRNSIHWGQLYVDEYPNHSYPDVTTEVIHVADAGLSQDDDRARA